MGDVVDALEAWEASTRGVIGVALIHNDPEHWRERAAEARALAEKMTDATGKKAMSEIADSYDRIAARAFERISQPPPQSK